MRNVNATAIKLARTAASASDAEREAFAGKLAAYCTEHNLNIADIIAEAAKPEPAKRVPLTDAQRAARDAARAPKPAPKPEATAKPEKPSKPAAASPNASDYDKRAAIVADLRATCATLYNGPSLAVRSNPKRVASAVYSDLFDAPKHRTDLSRLSARDESLLFTVLKRGDKAGAFDPVSLNLDAGVFSRLRSVGFIERAGDAYTLTADALAHARKAAKRAA